MTLCQAAHSLHLDCLIKSLVPLRLFFLSHNIICNISIIYDISVIIMYNILIIIMVIY